MGIFDNLWKKHGHKKNKEIQELLAEIKKLEDELHTLNKNRGPRFIAFFFTQSFYKSKFFIMQLNLAVGQKGDVLSIEIYDTVTGNVLSSAVGSAPTYAIDHPEFAALAADVDPLKEDISPVAEGAAVLSGTITADLSAYGLGTGVVLNVDPVNVVVAPAPPPPVTPAARIVTAPLP